MNPNELRAAVDEIPGWLFPGEAWRLYEVAREAEAAIHGATVVEVGSFYGRSAVALALGLQQGGAAGRMFTVDPQDDERHRALLANIESAGVSHLVESIRGVSRDASSRVGDGEVDVLFVDGSHEYEDVRNDLHAWEPKLRDGAVVGLNDPFWAGVNRAATEVFAAPHSPYREASFVDNTLFVRHRPSAAWGDEDARRLRRLRLVLRVGAAWYRQYHNPIAASGMPAWSRAGLINPVLWALPRIFARMLRD